MWSFTTIMVGGRVVLSFLKKGGCMVSRWSMIFKWGYYYSILGISYPSLFDPLFSVQDWQYGIKDGINGRGNNIFILCLFSNTFFQPENSFYVYILFWGLFSVFLCTSVQPYLSSYEVVFSFHSRSWFVIVLSFLSINVSVQINKGGTAHGQNTKTWS